MKRECIRTDRAPEALGHYSQAVRCEGQGFLFCAGQIAIDPETGNIDSGDITAQTNRVLENIKAILKAAGLDLSNVVKTTVFLHDLSEFEAMNAVYGQYFSSHPPARATVQVSRLPKDVKVEIEAVACY